MKIIRGNFMSEKLSKHWEIQKNMKIEIVNRETIKPSSPTPINLRRFKLSVMDQLTAPIYTPIVLFYPSASAEAAEKLKESLSETLTHFYPLAGRIKDNNNFIECNDEGAVYFEAQVHGVLLSDLLRTPNIIEVGQVIPVKIVSPDAATGPLLVVEVSFFNCGGLSISVCMSHILSDASTLNTFIRAWVALSLHDDKLTSSLLPHFETTAFRFPGDGRDISAHGWKVPDNTINNPTTSNCFVTKRFVFDASKITSLKAKAAGETVEQPTRFEAVTALIWRCAIAAATRLNSDLKNHVLNFSVNLRKRIVPSLPENSFGNFICMIIIQATSLEDEGGCTKTDQLKDLVGDLRLEIKEFRESKTKKKLGGDPDDALEIVSQSLQELADTRRRSKEMTMIFLSTWCNFQFYEADFGWGKPRWVSMVGNPPMSMVKLMDTREAGGMEAWVTLHKQEMEIFECDPQLRQFADSNPSVSL